MPLVSIIINVRNGAPFVGEAIESVLAQSFTDWELILWDDCSTDDSAKIIGKYNDVRIRYYLSADETPLGEARNRAIALATGDWLAFLDQDDIWLPHKLARQMSLVAADVAIIYGRTVLFDTRGNLRDYDHSHEFTTLPEGNIFSQLISDACFIAMSSAVLRRSAVDEIGRIPDSIQVVPDWYLYVALAQHYSARAVQDVVCRYRVHPASMTASQQYQLRLHQEPLLIIAQWATQLDPQVVGYRRRTFSTVLALEEIKNPRTILRGLKRLFTEGSPPWLCTRPFAVGWRSIRRRLRRPYWLATEFASDPD